MTNTAGMSYPKYVQATLASVNQMLLVYDGSVKFIPSVNSTFILSPEDEKINC